MILSQNANGTFEETSHSLVPKMSMPIVTQYVKETGLDKGQDPSFNKKIKIPERQRKAASLQYHPAIDNHTHLVPPKPESVARPRVSCSNLESLRIDETPSEVHILPTKPNMPNVSEIESKDSCHRKSLSTTNDTTWDKVKKAIPGNIINSFSVPTSPTELCSPNLFDDIPEGSPVNGKTKLHL